MIITILHNNHEFANIEAIIEALGYKLKKESDVGGPYFPILIRNGNNVELISGKDSKRYHAKKLEGYKEVTMLQFILQLIINSNKLKK